MGLSEAGEFGLIRRLRSRLSMPSDRIDLGIGDDAALVDPTPGWEILLTIDTLVEQVHFDLSYTPIDALGWKSLAINLSDVAAMGGLPRCAVISLGISDAWSLKKVDDFVRGLKACSETFHCPVVGGDTVRVPRDSVITVTVMGEAEPKQAVTRSGARPGDSVCVTGELGHARTGLETLTGGVKDPEYGEARDRFLRPVPRIRESRQLLKNGGLTAMIDISDGLASEIHHICRESRVGCNVSSEQIPIAPSARRWIQTQGRNPVDFVLESGEEYELLFTMRPEAFQRLDIPNIRKIGEIREISEGIMIEENGRRFPMQARGWDHFGP